MTAIATSKPPCLEGRGMAHHWQYTTPNGPIVSAICKYCGAQRRDRVDPHESGSWSEWHGLPAERHRPGGDYYPTGLQERPTP